MQKYLNTITDLNGTVIVGASVKVLTSPAGATATIYSDNGITVRTNHISTDSNGYFEFYAANGRYSLQITYNGAIQTTISDIVIEDITSGASYTITGGTINSTPVGATTPSTGSFSTLSTSGAASLNTLTMASTATFQGGLLIELGAFAGGSWIDIPRTQASGIGAGGAGVIPYIGYCGNTNYYFNGTAVGDIVQQNASGTKIHVGIDNGSGTATPAYVISSTAVTYSINLVMATANQGLVLKRGSNGKCGTFVATGVTPVTVSNTSIAVTDCIIISLNTVGGTVGVQPHVATITASTGFTVVCTATDTSTYNYAIISNAA